MIKCIFLPLHKTTFMCRNVTVTGNGYLLQESSEDKTAFFSNAMKNKHGKDCSTSFDVAILIKTLQHIF